MATLTSCPACGYPVQARYEGQTAVCANCGEKMEAVRTAPVDYPEWWGKSKEGLSNRIRIGGVEIPTPLFAGGIGFLAGLLLGPALIASTDFGRRWLEQRARGG